MQPFALTESDRRIDRMRLRSLLPAIAAIASLIMTGGALSGWPRSFAAELPWLDPNWLQAHVGEGEGQIAPVVLQRARALYLKKVSEGAINNPCYFAMDATRPGGLGRRFYVICEAERTFRAVPSGHATAATWKASRILQTTFAAQRTSAMRWIPNLRPAGRM
jgi:hypothetical protein